MKQKLRNILILIFAILLFFIAYFFFRVVTADNQKIYVKYNSNVSTNGTIETVVGVLDKNENTKKSNLTLQLLDKNNKKVKGVKEKYKLEKGNVTNCSLKIPDNLETGNYTLKLVARNGLLKTNKEVEINISNENSSKILISLDKGIYKPGDTINYRALIISKNDSKPDSNKEVNINIFDGNGNKVYSESTNTTEFGVVSGAFTLASEVNSGSYTISVDSDSNKIDKTFTVNPYILPQFEVSITSDKDVYQIGDIATITFNSKYFFGEPVANASVIGKIGDEEIKGITDADGNYIYTYTMKDKGEKDIEVSVTDTSNYLIEANKKIYAQEYAFEVETIFEHDHINKNMYNEAYLVAKKIDDTPVKAHIAVNIGNIKRQIITDENGIGKFTITSEDTSKFYSTVNYSIVATDNEGNTYSDDSKIDVVENSISVSTNKFKYDQGEDIEVNLDAVTESLERTIYICKNGEVLKMVSTDHNAVKLNLGDVSGLVDIFVQGSSNSKNYDYDDYYFDDNILSRYTIARSPGYYSNYQSNNFIKKTIFIKPSKSLDIAIATDKDEYKPGENINLNFEVKNQDNEKVDANILVSILDEAVLSLADNDLSMDNIRLALEDIKLTDDTTAADLYADVLSDKSDSKLALALIRHAPSEPSVKEDDGSEYYRYDYVKRIIILIIALVFVIIIYVELSDSDKAKGLLKDVLNVFVIAALILWICGSEIFDLFETHSVAKTIILVSAVVIMVYCLALYKKRENIFKILKNLVLFPGIYVGILTILLEIANIDGEILLLGSLLIPITMTILIVISRKHKLNKFWTYVKELTIILVKAGLAYLVAGFITDMFYWEALGFIATLLVVYFLIEKIYTQKTLKLEPPETTLNIWQLLVVGLFIAILVLFIMSVTSNFSSNVLTEAGSSVSSPTRDYDWSMSTFDDAIDSTSVERSTPDFSIAENFMSKGSSNADSASSSGLNPVTSMLDNAKKAFSNESKDTVQDISKEVPVETQENFESENKTENIRNVFLESLAFVPDLIAKDGKANTEIKLSDNITTWNIQAVGNTKEGSIGSNSATFKVFKEFFVDFSLPTNSVVTDKTNIPLTIYNYKDTPLTVSLNVVSNDWSKIGEYANSITIDAGATQLAYIPLKLIKSGNNTLRIEAKADGVSDIVERKLTINPNGYKKTKVISSSTIDKSFETDYFTSEEAIENTRKLKVKIYPSAISQAVEGMESIFRLPTGCFEQTSSSLYPNILALKYLEDNKLDNTEIREKALEYISIGYQRILTFEVSGEKGGYSLYGHSPAEPVITAFGLMELNDASEVYDVDKQVIENMKEYLFKVQKVNGSFNIGSTYIGSAGSESDLAMNAYIIWALSEVAKDDTRLNSSIKYLEDNLNKVEDNYTLALMANAFTNANSKQAKNAINKLIENVKETSDSAYIESNIRDYYGSCGQYQNLQATALTSMALSKNNSHTSINNSLVKYLISNKDSYGNWGTTQATILSLKAINMASSKGKIAGQTIQVSLNDETKDINVKNNPLDIYELEFTNVKDENKISFNMKKGNLTYELIEEYYVPYESIAQNEKNYKIDINQTIDANVKINDAIVQTISVANQTTDTIENGLVTINIPQGCSVNEMYLERLVTMGIIEKYEYNYSTLNLYLRHFKSGESKTIEVNYKANFPEEITGGAIRAYDYYNPEIEGVEGPVKIVVTE